MYADYPAVKSRRERTCLAYVPWVAIFAILVVFVGLGFWVDNGVQGGKNAAGTLSTLGVKYANSDMVENAIVGTSVVLVFLVVGLLGVSLYRCLLEYRRDTEGRLDQSSLYLGINASANTALWCMTVWIYIAFGIFAVAAAATYALDKGISASVQNVDKSLDVARTIYDAAEDLVGYYEAHGNSTNPLDPLHSRVLELKQQLHSKSICPAYCLDLTRLTFIKGDRCICDSAKLKSSQMKAHAAWKALVPSIFGLVVVFIGCSWLSMNLVAQFVRTHSDTKWTRDTEEVLLIANQHSAAATQQKQFMQMP